MAPCYSLMDIENARLYAVYGTFSEFDEMVKDYFENNKQGVLTFESKFFTIFKQKNCYGIVDSHSTKRNKTYIKGFFTIKQLITFIRNTFRPQEYSLVQIDNIKTIISDNMRNTLVNLINSWYTSRVQNENIESEISDNDNEVEKPLTIATSGSDFLQIQYQYSAFNAFITDRKKQLMINKDRLKKYF